jgi:hypothetical protein
MRARKQMSDAFYSWWCFVPRSVARNQLEHFALCYLGNVERYAVMVNQIRRNMFIV